MASPIRRPQRIRINGEQPALGVAPPVEVGGLLDLGHDLLGQRARQALGGFGEVVGVERRADREAVVPAVAADRVEERVQRADVPASRVLRAGVGGQVGQVALQQRPVQASQIGHRRRGLQEPGQARDAPGGLCRPDSDCVRRRAASGRSVWPAREATAGRCGRTAAAGGPRPPAVEAPRCRGRTPSPSRCPVQILDALEGVAQERKLAVLLVPGA